MISFRRFPFVPVALVAAAVAIVVAAALTSWCVLLALIPLAMMLGCATRMAAHLGMPGGPSAARGGCCAAGALSPADVDPEPKGATAPPAS